MHLKDQNWIAVGLDLVVVVLGIFLAFQVERWYAKQLARSDAQERVDALIEDFAGNAEELEFQVQRRKTSLDAAAELLQLDERDPTVDDFDRFYNLLAWAQRGSSTRFRRGSYEVLISTGEIDLISDADLRKDIEEFFDIVDELDSIKAQSSLRLTTMFEPYVVENLDHVKMLEFIHPASEDMSIAQTRPSQDPAHFLTVVGTAPFEGVVAAMWHASRDELGQLAAMSESLESIQNRLSQFASE
jgi:hypothetical protein